jgi:hypothetical protein
VETQARNGRWLRIDVNLEGLEAANAEGEEILAAINAAMRLSRPATVSSGLSAAQFDELAAQVGTGQVDFEWSK